MNFQIQQHTSLTGKRRNLTLKNRGNKEKSETKTEEQFEQQQWSHTCSETFNSNIYGTDHQPSNPH